MIDLRVRAVNPCILFGVLLLGACDGDGSAPSVATIESAGTATEGQVGSAVAVRVRIVDDSGSPIEGIPVQFAITAGEGSVSPQEELSGSGGIASAIWTLGGAAGLQRLRAVAGDQVRTLEVEALPGPPMQLTILSGERPGTVGEALPDPVRVQVEDQYGNGVPAEPISFTVIQGGGSVSPSSGVSDDRGRASATWTLGTTVGVNRLEVRAGAVASSVLHVVAQPGAPSELISLSGDGQTGEVGTTLSEALVVEVRDEFGNPVPGVGVTFNPGEDGGGVDPSSTTTGGAGRASTVWTLGTSPGTHYTEVLVSEVDPVRFEAHVEPGPPAAVEAVSGDEQSGFAGATLSDSIVAQVTDEYGNPVADIPVEYSVIEGGGSVSPETARSADSGRVATAWTLGPLVGIHRLEATVDGVAPAMFSATAASGPPAEIEKLSGDGQSGEVGSTLSEPLVVRVLDEFGNPVPGTAVDFVVVGEGGSASPEMAETDDSGQAQTTWTLGLMAGTRSLEAHADGVESPAVFTATGTPAAPVKLSKVSGDGQTAPPGGTLSDPVVVAVEDEFGNGVPEVKVNFTVVEGGGSVSQNSEQTGTDGQASATWTVGSQVGSNKLEVTSEGLESLSFSATTTSGSPHELEKVSGDGQTATVGSELPAPVVVRVLDEYGNPLPGVAVQFAVVGGGGGVTPQTISTDGVGAASARWTLGTAVGSNTLEATAEEIETPVTFSATGTPGPPASLQRVAGDQQGGAPGSSLPDPFVVRTTDQYGNGVSGVSVTWEVVEGNGSLSTTSSVSGSDGLADTHYTLGDSFGEESVRASSDGLGNVNFIAYIGENNLVLDGMYITQAAQSYSGAVPLVADREGVLRIFVRAASQNNLIPTVRVQLFQNGTPFATHTLDAPLNSVPTAVSESSLSDSWNLALSGSDIRPGLSVSVEVDPDQEVPETDESDNRLPRNGSPEIQDVRTIQEFETRLVPVHIPALGTTGDVDGSNADQYLSDVSRMMPMPGYDVDVRSTFTTSVTSVSERDDWSTMLSEVYALRTAEGSARYYYGVIGYISGIPYCGLGYIGAPAALGVDICGASTAAHEWGHNWGRRHAPCGNPPNPDANYPYSGGSIGIYGLDINSGALKSPNVFKDLMSYCEPEWVSDYTYSAVLSFRGAEAALASARAAPQSTLIIWGRITQDQVVLEPTFRARTVPVLPESPGPYRLRGLKADGERAFELAFDVVPLDHAPGHGHFAFAVPTDMWTGDLDRLVLTGLDGRRSVVERPGVTPTQASARMLAQRTAGGQVRVTWNEAATNMTVVRDPRTGEILAFGRDGGILLPTELDELSVQLAPGLGSVEVALPIR